MLEIGKILLTKKPFKKSYIEHFEIHILKF